MNKRLRFGASFDRHDIVRKVWGEVHARGLVIDPEFPPFAKMHELFKVYDIEVSGTEKDVRSFVRWFKKQFDEFANLNETAAQQGLPKKWQR